MKVVLDGLPPDGKACAGALDDKWLFDAARQALEAKPRELSAALHVRKESKDRFRVTGELAVSWRTSCDRCVRPLTGHLEGAVDLLYQRGKMSDGEEVDLEAEDLDLGWVEGGSLDLGDVVSEQVALWLPDRILCSDGHAKRADSDDNSPCVVPEHDGGPDLQKKSPFSSLANWKPSH